MWSSLVRKSAICKLIWQAPTHISSVQRACYHPLMASPRALVLSPPMLQTPSRRLTINRVLPRVITYTHRHHHRPYTYKPHTFTSSITPIYSPNLSFLRRFFSSSPAQLEMAAAAKTKAQAIIDENPVGEFTPSALNLPCIFLTLNQPSSASRTAHTARLRSPS